MGLGNRLKTFGLMPDIGKLTDMFDEKFRELIQHIDAGFDRVVAKLEETRGGQQ